MKLLTLFAGMLWLVANAASADDSREERRYFSPAFRLGASHQHDAAMSQKEAYVVQASTEGYIVKAESCDQVFTEFKKAFTEGVTEEEISYGYFIACGKITRDRPDEFFLNYHFMGEPATEDSVPIMEQYVAERAGLEFLDHKVPAFQKVIGIFSSFDVATGVTEDGLEMSKTLAKFSFERFFKTVAQSIGYATFLDNSLNNKNLAPFFDYISGISNYYRVITENAATQGNFMKIGVDMVMVLENRDTFRPGLTFDLIRDCRWQRDGVCFKK